MPGKIFEASEVAIKNILLGFKEEHNFAVEEIEWSVLRVEKATLHIFVHAKLGILIENLLSNGKPRHNHISFKKDDDPQKWKLVIAADGHESLFFLGLLCEIKENLDELKANKIVANKKLIQESLEKVTHGHCSQDFKFKVYYRKKIYFLSVKCNGEKILLKEATPEEMQETIKEKIPSIIRELLHKKMLRKEVDRVLKKAGLKNKISSEDVTIETGEEKFLFKFKLGTSSINIETSGSLALCDEIRQKLPEFLELFIR